MSADAVVHVIDDDESVRKSLDFLLRAAGFRTATYETALAFLNALPDVSSGCIVTDVKMPEVSGVDLLKRLRDMHVRLPVIVITGHADVPMAVEAMKNGAVDFLEKPFDDEVLLVSVRAALAAAESTAEREAARHDLRQRIAALSRREREVLDGLVAGKANKTIAWDLGISPRTVEIYRANVMTKMRAVSLSELVRMTMLAEVADHPVGSDGVAG
ncbi:response regulator FixJ [Rhodoplanes roseus]|uniref:DNA-binding response regulator n=1 Tax=Rhodoplanes roseus TaxID=29409 RepID=A0A327KW74_9BRAD|nr:response regulator FixJ [Rhodoplanes roseus]RAI43059.1 DNA-binding response regulator [Rhodoplanes roseus]